MNYINVISARALSNSAAHDSLKSVAQKSVSAVLLVLISGEECEKKKKKKARSLPINSGRNRPHRHGAQ